MTETLLLAVRLRAEAAVCLARHWQAHEDNQSGAAKAWATAQETLLDLAEKLEASASEPASTVTDAAIVAQARLVRELQRAHDFGEAHLITERQHQEQRLDAMLKASEVTA
jgi:hypothetical protein